MKKTKFISVLLILVLVMTGCSTGEGARFDHFLDNCLKEYAKRDALYLHTCCAHPSALGIREKDCDPRDVYATHLSVLKERMEKGVPKQSQYCTFDGGLHEKYHFADLGFIPIWPNPATNIAPRTVEAIRSLGMEPRHKHPLIDTVAPATERTGP